MNDRRSEDELELLLVSVLENKASNEEFTQLLESLKSSPKLRRRASLFLCDESLLADEIGTSQQAASLVDSLSAGSLSHDLSANTTQSDDTNLVSPRLSFARRLSNAINENGWAIAVAASLLVIGLGIQNYTIMKKVSRLHNLGVVDIDEPKPKIEIKKSNKIVRCEQPIEVGRVIGLRDAVWAQDEKKLAFGEILLENQSIHLVSGAIELLLSTGAKITVEGPVDFELPSSIRTNLSVGKIAAAIPRTARGYTIMTPTSELVDIGTQFGVSVNKTGETELHVFDGDVVARSRLTSDKNGLVHAKEHEGLLFDSSHTTPKHIKAHEAVFVRHLGPTYTANDLPAIPVTEDLILWLTADTIPEANDGQAISTWRDLLIGENTFPNDALQFDSRQCPRYVTDDQDRPALRFDGWATCLNAGPLESTEQCTFFVVCSPGPSSFTGSGNGGILLKYGNFQTAELAMLSNHSVRGIGWSGHLGNVGLIQGAQLPENQLAVIGFQYDSKNSTTQLWINGVSQGQAKTSMNLQESGMVHIGRHNNIQLNAGFFGNIYEVILFKKSLETKAMTHMATYFEERYESP